MIQCFGLFVFVCFLREIPNPTHFQWFQPHLHYLAWGTLPAIRFSGSLEDQEARNPDDLPHLFEMWDKPIPCYQLSLLTTAVHQALVSFISASLICIHSLESWCWLYSTSSSTCCPDFWLLPSVSSHFIPGAWSLLAEHQLSNIFQPGLPSQWLCLTHSSAFWPSPSLLWCCSLALSLVDCSLTSVLILGSILTVFHT